MTNDDIVAIVVKKLAVHAHGTATLALTVVNDVFNVGGEVAAIGLNCIDILSSLSVCSPYEKLKG